jgi:hypothetical protein
LGSLGFLLLPPLEVFLSFVDKGAGYPSNLHQIQHHEGVQNHSHYVLVTEILGHIQMQQGSSSDEGHVYGDQVENHEVDFPLDSDDFYLLVCNFLAFVDSLDVEHEPKFDEPRNDVNPVFGLGEKLTPIYAGLDFCLFN